MSASRVILLALCCTTVLGLSDLDSNAAHRQRRSSIDDMVLTYVNQALSTMKDLLKHGIPDFGIAPLEPVKLDNMTVNIDKSGAHVRTNLTNMTLYGLSTLTVQKVLVNLANQSLNLSLSFSNWTVNGNYNMTGQVMKIVPVGGVGPFVMEADGVVMNGSAALHRFPNGSLGVTGLALNLTVESVKSHFHHLNGGGAIGALSNTIINVLSKSIFNRAKPKLISKLTTTLEHSLNSKLRTINLKF